jgi:hypothetical protein
MLDQLKRIAMQQLMSKMAGNALGASQTEQAAEGGANGLIETITNALKGGSAGEVEELLSNNGNSCENNSLFQNIQSKIQESLQAQGMSEEEAQTEAANTAPSMIEGLKEKFESKEEADSGFNLDVFKKLTEGGGLGDLLSNPGGLMGAAKNLLGK